MQALVLQRKGSQTAVRQPGHEGPKTGTGERERRQVYHQNLPQQEKEHGRAPGWI